MNTSQRHKIIGRYPISRLLGSGTMGRVYKVTVPLLKKTAALKLFKPARALVKKVGLKPLEDQFIHEASVIANIRHPNVAQIWSLEQTDDQLFYLMDYYCRNLGKIMGETYWAETPSRIIPVEQAGPYILQILNGLARLHDARIIHQDIKPFNIMMSDMGIIKIVDFGLSRRRGERQLWLQEELTLGTPFYTAPEQQTSPEKADSRSDLYSTGVILHRMISGRFPENHNMDLSSVQPGLGPDWNQFIQKALEPEPGDRYPDARTMATDLERLMDTYDPSVECFQAAPLIEPESLEKPLRTTPKRILGKHALKAFHLNTLHQPKTYIRNRFEPEGDCIVDHATGLIWQYSGSQSPLQWEQAADYIEELSNTGFCGHSNWRLPTINELLSLLNPSSMEGFCHDPAFCDIQKCLWSADTRSKRAAWAMDLEMGFIDSSDRTDFHFVKGVCSIHS